MRYIIIINHLAGFRMSLYLMCRSHSFQPYSTCSACSIWIHISWPWMYLEPTNVYLLLTPSRDHLHIPAALWHSRQSLKLLVSGELRNLRSSIFAQCTLRYFIRTYTVLLLGYASWSNTHNDFLTDCREWLTWLDEIKWLLTFRLTGLFRAHCASVHIHSFLLAFFPFIFN